MRSEDTVINTKAICTAREPTRIQFSMTRATTVRIENRLNKDVQHTVRLLRRKSFVIMEIFNFYEPKYKTSVTAMSKRLVDPTLLYAANTEQFFLSSIPSADTVAIGKANGAD